jgi:Icc protein
VTFHTAMSTAFPQPAPGSAPAPGPMKVPAEKLRSVLGLADVHYVAQKHSLAVVDTPLEASSDQPKEGARLWSPSAREAELFG